MGKGRDSMSATPSCHRKRIIRLPRDQYTQLHAHKNTDGPINWRQSYYKHNRGARGFVPSKLGHDWKPWEERIKETASKLRACMWGGGMGVLVFSSNTITCPPSLHMAVFDWNFTQLRWDCLKPPFVFLSIIVFALSWSYGFSAAKLFAAAPLPPTWLTDVWGTGINIAVTDMFSLLCCLLSLWAKCKKQNKTKLWIQIKKVLRGSR